MTLAEYLKAQGRTQEQLAQHLGIRQATVSTWVRQTRRPKAASLRAIETWAGRRLVWPACEHCERA